MKSLTTPENFWNRVNKTNTCWLWTGPKRNGKYGAVGSMDAHRISWMLTFGDPGSLFILHKCDVKTCVRPDHLFLGTQADNVADCVKKGRTSRGKKRPNQKFHRGEASYQAKLKAKDIPEIFELHIAGLSFHAIAKRFSVTAGAIRFVIVGRNWKSVSGGAPSIS